MAKKLLYQFLQEMALIWSMLAIEIIVTVILYVGLNIYGISKDLSLLITSVFAIILVFIGLLVIYGVSSDIKEAFKKIFKRGAHPSVSSVSHNAEKEAPVEQNKPSQMQQTRQQMGSTIEDLTKLSPYLDLKGLPTLPENYLLALRNSAFIARHSEEQHTNEQLIQSIDNLTQIQTEQQKNIEQLSRLLTKQQESVEQLTQGQAEQQESIKQLVQLLTKQQESVEQLTQGQAEQQERASEIGPAAESYFKLLDFASRQSKSSASSALVIPVILGSEQHRSHSLLILDFFEELLTRRESEEARHIGIWGPAFSSRWVPSHTDPSSMWNDDIIIFNSSPRLGTAPAPWRSTPLPWDLLHIWGVNQYRRRVNQPYGNELFQKVLEHLWESLSETERGEFEQFKKSLAEKFNL